MQLKMNVKNVFIKFSEVESYGLVGKKDRVSYSTTKTILKRAIQSSFKIPDFSCFFKIFYS